MCALRLKRNVDLTGTGPIVVVSDAVVAFAESTLRLWT